jgi:hypothetical protein
VTSSRATNRTATFVFYIGERYFGVITAFVQGREAANYKFTSALPVTLMKQLAPAIVARMENKPIALPNLPAAEGPAVATKAPVIGSKISAASAISRGSAAPLPTQ